MPFDFPFLIEICIEIIVDLLAVVRNNIVRTAMHFIHFPPMVIFGKTIYIIISLPGY